MVVPVAFKEVSGVAPPTIPERVTVPLPDSTSAFAPLIVEEKLRLEPVAVTAFVNVTGPVIEIALEEVVRLLFKLMAAPV